MRTHRLSRLWAIIALPALFATLVFAQGGLGTVSGLITDASGAPVAGTAVTLTNPATGARLQSRTSSAGLYSFPALNPGTYELQASHAGFASIQQRNITVAVDHATAVNLTLHPGTVHQVVEVTAAPGLAATTNTTVGQLISAEMINRVPLVTRDVYQLVQLTPGITPVNGVVNNVDFNARPGAEVSGYTINGAQQGSLYYTLDGSPISIGENNLGSLIPAFQPPLDSIQEYRVETNNVTATQQSGGAGVISLVSKSGTNKFHGDLFAYARPNALDANDSFAKAAELEAGQPNKPLNFHRYQEGGSIGGPILHNKLFFFADYEATQQESLQTGSYTVPTAAERQGNFSADPFTVYNPLVADQANGTRQPFAGNIISSKDINPIAQNYLQYFPLPNQAGTGPYHVNNYFASGLDPDYEQKFDIRIDDTVSGKQHIFGRFSFGRLRFGNADLYGQSNIFDPNYYQNITNDRNFELADDYILTSNTILQLRYSFTRHYENQTGDPRQVGFDMTSLGYPASLAAEQTYNDIPIIYFGGATANLGSEPWTTFHFATMNHDFIAALDTVHGRHDIQMGFEFEKQFMNDGQPVAPSGWYLFDNTATSSTTYAGDGSDFASFLLGMGSAPGGEWQNAFTKDIFAAEANPYYAAYIQDNFHVSTNFTLDLGLRWDIFGGRTERYNRLESFDPTTQYTISGVPMTGGEQFVTDGDSPFTTNMKDFGPRVGFSWQPIQNLVWHGGLGIFYGPSTHMVSNPSLNSDSFFSTTYWNATSVNADGNTVMLNSLSKPFPGGVVPLTYGALGPATNLGSVLATAYRSQPEPTTYDFNFGFQYQLPSDTIFSAAWVGSRGLHLPVGGEDINELSLQTIAKYKGALQTKVPNPYEAAVKDPTSAMYGAATIYEAQAIQGYPQFTAGGFGGSGVTISGAPIADSIYHSLQLKLQKRLTSHFTTLVGYTWGKLLTDGNAAPLSFIGTNTGSHQDIKNISLDRSLSTQDVSNWLSWQTSYDLPVGPGRLINLSKGLANTLIGGWTVNTIVSLSSGIPVAAPNGTGDVYFSQRPNQTCDPASGAANTAAQWFNWTCFQQPASPYFPGTTPSVLTHVRTDGTSNIDASLFKNFPLGENRNIQFQVAAYNLTNSVQLGYPSVFWNQNAATNPAVMDGFGQITAAANTPRQLQFGLRFTF